MDIFHFLYLYFEKARYDRPDQVIHHDMAMAIDLLNDARAAQSLNRLARITELRQDLLRVLS